MNRNLIASLTLALFAVPMASLPAPMTPRPAATPPAPMTPRPAATPPAGAPVLAVPIQQQLSCDPPAPHGGYPPLNQYIDAAAMMPGVCDVQDPPANCQNGAFSVNFNDKLIPETLTYYKAIGVLDDISDPTHPVFSAARGTFDRWKQTMGFSQVPTNPGPDELRATYWNDGDLQFGRDMHCRVQVFGERVKNRAGPVTYACYVENYATTYYAGPLNDPQQSIVNASNAAFPLNAVAMEVTAVPQYFRERDGRWTLRSWQFGDVAFIAYLAQAVYLTAYPIAELDSQHSKSVPGTCMACHGGNYLRSTATTLPRVVGANFLPFDTASFIYQGSGPLTEVAQREVFRKLNGLVQSTHPPRRTVSDLISGWYQWCGGVGAPNCFIDDAFHPFIPGDPATCSNGAFCSQACSSALGSEQTCGWWSGQPVSAASKPGFDVRRFYTEVVGKLCRNCHVALSDRFNVQNFNEWTNRAYPSVAITHTMPFAEVPYLKYAHNLRGASGMGAQDYFEAFFSPGPPLTSVRNKCRP
jgi:hypothetical protein